MEKNSHLPLLFLLLSATIIPSAATRPTAIYAFGDSILDSGNNNKLLTVCRANHKPYGIDFPGQSHTGRFSNGKLPGDMLVSAFRIKEILPAYADSTLDADDLDTGVSFASACSGLHDLTAAEVGVLNLDKQFQNFEQAFVKMEERFGLPKATATVQGALFMISAGSSDMIDNYYLLPTTRAKYPLPAYHDMLLKNLVTFVKKLYNAGAKNIAIIGLPPLGCLPMDTTVFSPPSSSSASSQKSGNLTGDLFRRECKMKHNKDAMEYNAKLEVRVKRMMVEMPTLKVIYMDLFTPMMDMIDRPNKFGFKTTLKGCCGSGSVELGPLCNVASIACHVHSEYVFWDSINPSEAAYKALTNNFKARSLRRLYPSSV
ncbi:GDSL esterase/lipase At2g40250-like [Salvia splendens]|uniref:GDSL esterase/lipase At2g40250-like n=1 Tax=Salvia splendens TaxID=180675 RepID=UPI001C266DE8|nr:GDSL esterase/lipase At2g40250-like [Salvia splendens]